MILSVALNNLSNYSFEYILLHCHKSYIFFCNGIQEYIINSF